MTSELRPAVAVWIDAKEAYARSHKPDPKDSRVTFADPFAAAAVIEADRKAVRAEQAAYLAKARKEAGQNHDLHMAAVNEVVNLKAELAKFKALAETLAGAMRRIHKTASHPTNPSRNLVDIKSVSDLALHKYDEALRQYKEAHDER